ncbi:hypothetical protein RvY_15852 [Ramazzottius varieornatus]|uniref:CHCH domain-containing protein n=1 Tax=Ramazzottius varieornatus TaxID=947166 RepID=A0A1D1W326_RAMVA|nr:hypothetical protein RvY_15852 [Ramazzottius varieornatus]
MPRRGGGGSGRSSSPMSSAPRRSMTTAAPARAAPPPMAPVPHRPAPAAPMAAPAQQGPGMMGQIASTAIGVGIGSAVGHTIGHMMTGGSRGHEQEAPATQQAQDTQMAGQNYGGQQGYYQSGAQQQQGGSPCELEMKQFIECAQNNSSDISLCTGFNELLKSCKKQYGMQQ